MFNEPHWGYIGLQSLNSFDYNTELHLSHCRELIASKLQVSIFIYFQLYSICFPVIPVGNWTSNQGINMDTFIHNAN